MINIQDFAAESNMDEEQNKSKQKNWKNELRKHLIRVDMFAKILQLTALCWWSP